MSNICSRLERALSPDSVVGQYIGKAQSLQKKHNLGFSDPRVQAYYSAACIACLDLFPSPNTAGQGSLVGLARPQPPQGQSTKAVTVVPPLTLDALGLSPEITAACQKAIDVMSDQVALVGVTLDVSDLIPWAKPVNTMLSEFQSGNINPIEIESLGARAYEAQKQWIMRQFSAQQPQIEAQLLSELVRNAVPQEQADSLIAEFVDGLFAPLGENESMFKRLIDKTRQCAAGVRLDASAALEVRLGLDAIVIEGIWDKISKLGNRVNEILAEPLDVVGADLELQERMEQLEDASSKMAEVLTRGIDEIVGVFRRNVPEEARTAMIPLLEKALNQYLESLNPVEQVVARVEQLVPMTLMAFALDNLGSVMQNATASLAVQATSSRVVD